MKYRPEYDGLRAISAIMVLAFHAAAPFLLGGFLGVDIFFVISGFLITNILLREHEKSGDIDILRFYIKRFMRLTPPFAIMLIIYLLLSSTFFPGYHHHERDAIIAALYLSDFAKYLIGAPKVIGHTWSLSTEEHFYLIWPIILVFISKLPREKIASTLFIAYAAATIWRVACMQWQTWGEVYYRFDVRVSGLILGACLAAARSKQITKKINWPIVALSMMAATASATMARWKDQLSLQTLVIITEISTAIVIIAIDKSKEITRWLGWPPLAYIGKLSYGIYLFHFPITRSMRPNYEWYETMLVSAVLSTAMAALSYHTIEAFIRAQRWRVDAPTRVDSIGKRRSQTASTDPTE